MMSSVDIVQITDLHLGKSPDFNLAGINPVDSFNAVLDAVDIAGRGDDLLLLSGDLSGDSSAQAYVCLNEILRRRSKRAIWLPGNHDDLELMQAGLVNYPRSPVTDVGGWGIVSIDSSQVGTPAGFISDSELNLLDARLRQLSDRAVILSMHHCPINLGSHWLDHQKIANADELYALLSNYSNIKALDIGPGNCLIDEWIRKKSTKNFDENGEIARSGKVNDLILNQAIDNFSIKRYGKSFDQRGF